MLLLKDGALNRIEEITMSEKEKLKEAVAKLDENDEYIAFFCGMIERHVENCNHQLNKRSQSYDNERN